MIPRILHRVVGKTSAPQYEEWWKKAQELNPGWEPMTHRDPLIRGDWPATGDAWNLTVSGGQFASLVRLEALWRWGGIYLDQDVECYRSFEPLRPLAGFAAWEDPGVVPDAVMGFEKHHPAIGECIERAKATLLKPVRPKRIDQVIDTSVRVTTAVFVGRLDVLLLPPGSFYPYHYSVKDEQRDWGHDQMQPWAFCAHHWHATSWDDGEFERWQQEGPRSW